MGLAAYSPFSQADVLQHYFHKLTTQLPIKGSEDEKYQTSESACSPVTPVQPKPAAEVVKLSLCTP